MLLTLKTTDYRADGIFSDWFLDDTHFGVTLEHAIPDGNGGWMPKIPRGRTYICERGKHRLDHYNGGQEFDTFMVTGVDGHSGLLFHPGSYNRDSNGCILTGAVLHKDAEWWINGSVKTFETFMELLDGIDSFQLAVS